MLHTTDKMQVSSSDYPAFFKGEFQLKGWDVLVLQGPAKLLEQVDYISFTGDFGFRYPYPLPAREVIADHIENTRRLFRHFNANILNLEFMLPCIGSTTKTNRIAECEAFWRMNGDQRPGSHTDGMTKASGKNKWYLYLESLMVEVVKGTPFGAVSLANNHALDYGPKGLYYNEKQLKQAGATCFGTTQNQSVRLSPLSVEAVVFSMTDLVDRQDVENLIARLDDANIAGAKEHIKKTDFAAAFMHVTANRSVYPSSYELKLVDKLVDAGFKLIVCTGSHWIKGYALRGGVPVFFGTGNYLFSYDKDFTERQGMHVVAGLQQGRLVQLFVVPFSNDFKSGSCGPLSADDLLEFKKTFEDRSEFSRFKYWRDKRNLFELKNRIRRARLSDMKHINGKELISDIFVVICNLLAF